MNSQFTISSDVPPPQPQGKYPFAQMQVGQHLAMPCVTRQDSYQVATVRSAAQAYGKRHGVKWQSKRKDGVWRLWRVA